MWVAARRRGFCSEDLFLVAFVIGLICSGVFVWVVAKIGTRLPGWIWAFSVPYLMYTMASLVLWQRRRLRGMPYLAVLSDSIWCMTWRGAIANVPLSSVKKLTIHYAITGYSLRISRRPIGQTLVTNLFKTRELAIEAASEIGLRSGCELSS